MLVTAKTLRLSRGKSRKLVPAYGHESFWLHPYYAARQIVPNVPLNTMFSWNLHIFPKNRRSGGAVWLYDFHAGAWLRQAPASAYARHRGCPTTRYLHQKCDIPKSEAEFRVKLHPQTAVLVRVQPKGFVTIFGD